MKVVFYSLKQNKIWRFPLWFAGEWLPPDWAAATVVAGHGAVTHQATHCWSAKHLKAKSRPNFTITDMKKQLISWKLSSGNPLE